VVVVVVVTVDVVATVTGLRRNTPPSALGTITAANAAAQNKRCMLNPFKTPAKMPDYADRGTIPDHAATRPAHRQNGNLSIGIGMLPVSTTDTIFRLW
jgi:hypothetical protein